MKKVISMILVLVIIISSFAVFSTITSAAGETFSQGDTIYLDLSQWTSWEDSNPIFYVNFTDATKPAGGSVDIRTADKTQYDPKTGVERVDASIYKYVISSSDANKSCLRFWRGNDSTLWNYSVLLNVNDFLDGKNTIKVTGKNGEGELIKGAYYDKTVTPTLTLSKSKAEIGDTIDINLSIKESFSSDYTLDYEIYLDDQKVSSSKTYTYVAEKDGVFVVNGKVTLLDKSSKIVGLGTTSTSITIGDQTITALTINNIFVHGTSRKGNESEAWLKWKDYKGSKYFYLPTSLKSGDDLEFFNSFSKDATFTQNTTSVKLPAGQMTSIAVKAGSASISVNGQNFNCIVEFSSGEGAVFVNNVDKSQTDGKELWEYLTDSKENSAVCTAAVTLNDGSIIQENVKKMKGRGNTSWGNKSNPKWGWNLTFNNAIKLGTMKECKKFSLLSNFQDPSLNRNRFLYDLADEVGIPYASDSRFIDFYVNGDYKGCYMMAEKIDCGKNSLMEDFNEDDYLNYCDGTQENFNLCLELGGAGADTDEIGFSYNRVPVCVKLPGITPQDVNASKVKSYAQAKFEELFTNIGNASTVSKYFDIDSLAKVVLLNEYCKNWDAGASSVFYVYKPDSDGNWKWYSSPVWDYDNSIGNPAGSGEYMQPTGEYITSKTKENTFRKAYYNTVVKKRMVEIWFEQFLPAITKFSDSKNVSTGELWSQDVYYTLLKDQATMNYDVSPMTVDNGWIGNHSSLQTYTATYGYDNNGYVNKVNYVTDAKKSYDQYSFKGQYDYMIDWAKSRVAVLSKSYIDEYNQIIHPEKPTEPVTEPTTEEPTEEPDPYIDTTDAIAVWHFDGIGKTSGEKLKEYGDADDGYAATQGNGTLRVTVDGSKYRALEWSKAEYGVSGTKVVPIMGAGSKNQWYTAGTPYIEISDLDVTGYESVKFTAYLAGSKKAPANWKLQYSTDGNNFIDVPNGACTITIDDRKVLTAYLNRTAIPDTVSGKNNICLRLLANGKTTISGGDVDAEPDAGEIAINYIVVQAVKTGGQEIRGDANCDGFVTIVDVTAIQQYLANVRDLSVQGIKNASIIDGKVTIAAATKIQQYLANIIHDL